MDKFSVKTKIISCHDDRAENYDERVIKDCKKPDNFIREKYFDVHKEVLRMADLKAGESLLDIGIGTGLLEEMISEEINVSGIDISEKMMEKIKQKNLKVELSKGSFNKIPYEDRRFNVVVSCFAFHHLSDKEKEDSVLEMKRVLNNKGRIVIGDFMYLNESRKKDLIEKFQLEGRNDMIAEMDEENFTNIERFKKILEENGFDVEYKQVSTISWIMKANYSQADNPSSDLKEKTL